MIHSNVRSLILAAVVAVTTVFSVQAKAAADGEKALWVGGAAGVLIPNKSSTNPRGEYGVTVGAKIGTELGLGAYYFSAKKEEGGAIGKFDLDFYGIEGTYHFEGEAKGAYFGVRLGITKMDFGVPAAQVSASPFHVGVIGGYNHWVTDNLSIGGDLSFYSVSKGESTALSGTTVSVDSFSALSFLATVKLWL
ncbi:hypothetical protein BH10BDE1_BH10BDE1_29490 [soil metagenome]